MPGYLIPEDLERICKEIGVPVDVELGMSSFAASPGAVVAKVDDRTGKLIKFRIPTIVPRTGDDGRCVFMARDGSQACTIHEIAPYGCGWFDTHMSKEEADKRSHAGLLSILENQFEGTGEYHEHWEKLHSTGQVSASPEEKRAALKEN
jgi:Fe-S-cluster containining protein